MLREVSAHRTFQTACTSVALSSLSSTLLARNAAANLLEARAYADSLGLPIWEFAIGLDELRAAGYTTNDLRWLVRKRYVEHALETTLPGENQRSFRAIGMCGWTSATCFVISDAGYEIASHNASNGEATSEQSSSPNGHARRFAEARHLRSPMPRWDRDRQELRLGSALVKRFKLPACNQEAILAAFEEEGWPARIDDPLSPVPDQDPKRRLHDTINTLNRNQKNQLIRFMGDGSGEGVLWEYTDRSCD